MVECEARARNHLIVYELLSYIQRKEYLVSLSTCGSRQASIVQFCKKMYLHVCKLQCAFSHVLGVDAFAFMSFREKTRYGAKKDLKTGFYVKSQSI